MGNLIFSANIVLPLLVLMLVGFAARKMKLLDSKNASICNNIIFKIFLPILLFNNVRSSDVSNLGAFEVFSFVILMIISLFLITTLIVVKLEKMPARRGAMIQGICRPNYALFGIPLISMIFGTDGLGLASVLIAIVIPTLNVSSVIVLTCFGPESASVKSVLKAISKNPLIIATLLGMIVLLNGITFPSFLDKALTDLGSIATPFSLFILGAGFEFGEILNIKKQIIGSVIGKIILVPLFAISVAVLLGFRGVELGCIMTIFSAPTAVSSYTMAEKMGADAKLASAIIVFGSIFCILTVFTFVFLLKTFALI